MDIPVRPDLINPEARHPNDAGLFLFGDCDSYRTAGSSSQPSWTAPSSRVRLYGGDGAEMTNIHSFLR